MNPVDVIHTCMNAIDVRSIDLNLLVALDALLSERSVTRAARRCGVTQSSMSHSLARLRELLGDAVLVRSGRAMQPTPRATAMLAPLQRALAELGRVLVAEAAFEPGMSERMFSLVCPDLLAAFLPSLVARVHADAPRVRLSLHALERGDVARPLLDGAHDLALGPPLRSAVAGLMQTELGHVRWAVFGRPDHPALAAKRLSVRAWLAAPHVVVGTGSVGLGYVGEALAKAGLARRVGLSVPVFLLAPLVAAQTDMLFTAPLELIEPIAAQLGVVHRRPPIELPRVPVVLYWAERMQHDGGHRWLRERVAAVMRERLPARSSARP